ncbi:MAG TPA: lysophospholipid acyltransferase family protein [Acidimicrobiales bacterium]|jgi:1-acyl-sn-glycerol-3-phosphate acyltransferase|nr:lysophospholipid acyltransferase family protein [Acidimicrobiales bacterium]
MASLLSRGSGAKGPSPARLLKVPSVKLPRLPFPYSAPTVPEGVEAPERRRRSGPTYDSDWARRLPARLGRAALRETVIRSAVKALAAPELHGLDRLEALRADGDPVIFAANHHSHLDTPVLLTTVPDPWQDRLFVVAAADYFFRNAVTSALSALVINAMPFERTRINRRSGDRAAALIDDGWSMLIFPEGGRSPDGWGQPFRGGAAYLALRCDVPVVPIHIEGTSRILRKGKTLPTPSTVKVTFGPPLRPGEGDDARRFGAKIETAVAELADEATTDWWSARRRAHAGTTPGLTGPEAASWRRAWALGDASRRTRRTKRRWPDI